MDLSLTSRLKKRIHRSDTELLITGLDFHQSKLGRLPGLVVADGGYASRANVTKGRGLEVKRVVFNKPTIVSLQTMGVKSKTLQLIN